MGQANNGTPYQYNGIEHLDDLGLNLNMAFYRTLDPTIGRWRQVDPKGESSFVVLILTMVGR